MSASFWESCLGAVAVAIVEKSVADRKRELAEFMRLIKYRYADGFKTLNLSTSLCMRKCFNDSDFRKTGTIKRNNEKKPAFENTQNPKSKNQNKNNKKKHIDQNSTEPQKLTENGSGGGGANHDKFKKLPKLPLVKASNVGVWYVDAEELEKRVCGGGEERKKRVLVNFKEVERKRELGERLLWQYVADYEGSRGQTGDIKMLVATQRSGTAADKVSAFSVMVGDNPVANLRSLDGLLGMVSSKVGKRHALTGFEALKELFISSLLPDRKLKTLVQRPLNDLPETKDGYSLLLFWYFEECVKQRYERFVVALEEASRDMLPILKTKALKTIYALLTSKSEQENKLLSALVNKLGDPQNKGASNADYHLSNLLSDHPNMKAVVINEVDTFLFRPHLGLRSKYHAVNFLSQVRFSHKGDGPKVAKRLIDVYFALFKVLIIEASGDEKMDTNNKKEDKLSSSFAKESKAKSPSESHVEMDSRLLSALLTGINRAFPYVSSSEADDIIEVHTPMLFKLVHSNNFNVGVQALLLLDKISSKNQIAEMFIGLLLRAMKNDVNLKRVAAFSKRLLQVVLQQPPQYACGCLFLLSEVLKARPPLWNMVVQNESADDDDLEHFEDIVEETENEPSTAPKKEENNDVKTVNTIRDGNSDGDSSEDEDVTPPSDSEEDVSDESAELFIEDKSKDIKKSETLPDRNGNQAHVSSKPSLPGGYDPRHREPSYCNANRVSWWELMVLASHAHPSVSTMAGTLLSGANIVYNGNPLNDLTLTAFLDKFMEKKPKSSTWHGGSQIEPAKKLDMNNHLIGPEILSLAEIDVPPEDLVFHKFYMNKMNSTKKSKKKKKKTSAEDEAAEDLFNVDGDDDMEGGVDDSDNEEIDNMLDSANLSDGDYEYDDLDEVVNEDDDDLVGNAGDAETDAPSDTIEGEDFDISDDARSDNDDDDVDINIGDADYGSDDDEDEFNQRKRKRKPGKKAGASPFASLEEFEHLLNEEDESPTKETKSTDKKKPKSRKKRKSH
ncbi:hypothetical protein EZV62_003130 [Acer yangbiense]|uniref:CCAAT-binding factor domain-containing protein n=1 Tax=Acer yangbiense TaxID=1000413 RepID=A0A5C7IGM8_9ROSI|nr:hypothetical protein EZV62_003130 [Acer yangbiense]